MTDGILRFAQNDRASGMTDVVKHNTSIRQKVSDTTDF